MRWFVLAMLGCTGCTDPTGLGEASANAYDSAASATVVVANGTDGASNFRVWSIEIGEAPPGTDCKNRGDALIVFDVYTQLSSAPRGEIRMTTDVPPLVYPGVAVHYANGFAVDGLMEIDAASSTRILGSFRGQATLDGSTVDVDVDFDAPTCGV
jgi:hypothetical protein